MVWYIPPLSPVVDVVSNSGQDGEDITNLFSAIDQLRIPMEYLAGLFTAGDLVPIENSLGKLAAMRSYMRDINLGQEPNERIANLVGMTGEEIEAMYHLLAVAKYEDRYVIPKAHVEQARDLENLACSLDSDGGPGMGGPDDHGPQDRGIQKTRKRAGSTDAPAAVARFDVDENGVENFHDLSNFVDEPESAPPSGRIDLLGWSGPGTEPGIFPPSPAAGIA
jgi:nitrate reductase beta subunit